MLISYGMYSAINLDGGGSTTMFYNGTVMNYPADVCGKFRCTREVSAFFCLHRTTIEIRKQVLVCVNSMHAVVMVIVTIFIVCLFVWGSVYDIPANVYKYNII